MKWITQIPKTISNIKFPSHNKDIINVNLSILEILQSQLRWIRVYINKKLNGTVIEKQNAWNIFMVKNIILKGKTHKEKAYVDIRDDMRKIINMQ